MEETLYVLMSDDKKHEKFCIGFFYVIWCKKIVYEMSWIRKTRNIMIGHQISNTVKTLFLNT